MSTGIGKHELVGDDVNGAYSTPKAVCPYCGCRECEADYVDVGVGMVQCGPYCCPSCEASEASYLDKRVLTPREQETGWYEPGTPVSEKANTVNGVLVDHKKAALLYRVGLLDKKE